LSRAAILWKYGLVLFEQKLKSDKWRIPYRDVEAVSVSCRPGEHAFDKDRARGRPGFQRFVGLGRLARQDFNHLDEADPSAYLMVSESSDERPVAGRRFQNAKVVAATR